MDVVERFHEALAAGDSVQVADLLAPDAVILESGGSETKNEYLSHHFHSDAAFLGATTIETVTRRSRREGGVAWISSTSRIHGAFRGREVDLDSAELLLLRRAEEGWRIVAIHWSSSSRNR
jgi:ketosteroid isomerase-like protein